MLFSSLVFLSIFLPVLLLVYYTGPKHLRNIVLLVASLFFYGWGEPYMLSVMVVSIVVNYSMAMCIGAAGKIFLRKIILLLAVAFNLGLLFVFKYMDFFIINVNRLIGGDIGLLKIAMPIGISFYTFQAISYLLDVYRRDVPAERSLLHVGLYITFFPQLIAGPIVKFHEISRQIVFRTESMRSFAVGMQRFLVGLAKKVLIANVMGEFVDSIIVGGVVDCAAADAWLCAAAYAFQIFFDFSGYSDMAIGLGQMFGFMIPENFNYPYVSCTVTEFWRRWHISLSSWFREYLYIPLGGSHCSKFRTCINLLIVFLATGFWHGASWTFLLWGLWHGLFILIERLTGLNKKVLPAFFRVFQHIILLLIVMTGWVFFRADDFSLASLWLKKMFAPEDLLQAPVSSLSFEFIVMFCAAIFFSTLLPRAIYDRLREKFWFQIVWSLNTLVLLYLVFLKLAASSYNPFIYFRF